MALEVSQAGLIDVNPTFPQLSPFIVRKII